MDVYRTEEEQIAAIKSWWSANGTKILLAVVLAVGLFSGWKWYQKYEQDRRIAAVGIYQAMMDSYQQVVAGGAGVADADARLVKAGEQLVADYDDTPYAQFAALLLAGRAVETGDLPGAEKKLRAAVDQAKSDAMKAVATQRLARVLSAQGKHDDALALLNGKVDPAWAAAQEEVRGDVLMAQGKRAEAKAAWKKALDAAAEDDASRALLELKLAYVAAD